MSPDRPTARAILSALELLTKAEGSRGGKIIGHYASGRPKYAAGGGRHRSSSKTKEGPGGFRYGTRQSEELLGINPDSIHHIYNAVGARGERNPERGAEAAIAWYPHFTGAQHLEAAKHFRATPSREDSQNTHNAIAHTRASERLGVKTTARDWIVPDRHRSENWAAEVARFEANVKARTNKSVSGDNEAAPLHVLQALAKAEGSRGGHIIGHSKSGRPIYAVKGNKRELLHKLSRGENHVSVAASLKHGHYIGMFGPDHFKRADRHDQKAALHFAKARKADSVKAAIKLQRSGQAHADLSRAHRMMGQLSSDVRMPDHIREAAAMHLNGTHDKDKLGATKQRYFGTLGLAGHQRALSRHTRLHAAAVEAGHKATADHHNTMANTHRAVLHGVYGQKEGM